MVLVDALLPHPGRSWAETVPEAFAAKLKGDAVGGLLTPWPQWWGDARMRELVPDDELRDEFVRSCPSVPVDVIDEVMPDVPEPPAVFVQLSATYAPETEAAETRGWPVLVLDSHHLAPLTDPVGIADVIERAAVALPRPGVTTLTPWAGQLASGASSTRSRPRERASSRAQLAWCTSSAAPNACVG